MLSELIQSMQEQVRAIHRAFAGAEIAGGGALHAREAATAEALAKRIAELEALAQMLAPAADPIQPPVFPPSGTPASTPVVSAATEPIQAPPIQAPPIQAPPIQAPPIPVAPIPVAPIPAASIPAPPIAPPDLPAASPPISIPPSVFTPALDVVAGDAAVLLELALPGVDRADLTVDLAPGEIVVRGHRRGHQAGCGELFHAEIPRGSFYRSIPLPFPIERELRMELDRGVLRIYLSIAAATSREDCDQAVTRTQTWDRGEQANDEDGEQRYAATQLRDPVGDARGAEPGWDDGPGAGGADAW